MPYAYLVMREVHYEGSTVEGVFTNSREAVKYIQHWIKRYDARRSKEWIKDENDDAWSCEDVIYSVRRECMYNRCETLVDQIEKEIAESTARQAVAKEEQRQ